ncbi:MAG: metal ABC transporter ATP-binding protein [Chrysiogenetes bacterium]|nr:metal ABC transporter ATP-binding protein [Chrysiogenetes bacterium]
MSQVVLAARNVSFGYEQEAILKDVSIEIRAGDFLAVIGPNGGGKTTLLKVLLGLLRPWSGSVECNLPRGALGYVPQFSHFDPHFPLRVRDVVLMGRMGARGLMRRYSAEDRAAAEDSLARLGLSDLSGEIIGDLSGGQLQRVLIARALAGDPGVLLMDEPLASLDPESRQVLMRELKLLSEKIPVVVVTHDITPFAGTIKQIACVNRKLHYHEGGQLTPQQLEEAYGCPVELVAHGVPHRVLPPHNH